MDASALSIGTISADSHVTEPPNCFIDNIEAKYKDTAPHMITKEGGRGDVFVIPGMSTDIPYGRMAAAGRDPAWLKDADNRFDEVHRGGWDGTVRAADQDRDGVKAEIIFPTVGMVLCNHPDIDYKRACFDAYNRWILEFQAGAPNRLFCLPLTAITSVDAAIADVRKFKELGFKGVMFPGYPGTEEDYDHPSFDRLWSTLEELRMPVNFHVFAGGGEGLRSGGVTRGPAMNRWNTIIRANQDLIGMFVLSGIFERHPKLKIVGVEGDAGWAPHFIYRMDHAFEKHRYWLKPGADLKEKPSHYFNENVYLTFQDDWIAFKVAELMNPRRLLWANDFPHSDATWPDSQALLAEHTAGLDEQVKRWILHDNVAELYGLDL
ncbi:MAG TPA: amidohydrolase family protein [Caulobacteraceae bacterium]|nr:amidohydrolase family protein [Caulobacteraceae bacterium]